MIGQVCIVGAGPGDAGLMTVKGVECLKRAEVVIYDRLIDETILDIAPADAEKIYVGKSAKVHAMPQPEINRLLVEKASGGQRVVRLIGGDPFVFGRGGEEAEALAASGISFEVVPGISSSLAAPAYAGIPLTHRNVSSSFAVVTGHEDPQKELSSINWENLATGVDTLVLLVGLSNLAKIVAKLIACHRAPETPVALIMQGTTFNQKTLTGTLADIEEKAKGAGLHAPVVMVVGEVVQLKQQLSWFENRPLFGKRVLVTRSQHQAGALSALLAKRGAQAIELPVIDIQEVPDPTDLDQAILNLPDYAWVIFTSTNGVEAFWKRLLALGLDARQFARSGIAAIGPATARALAERGLIPDFMPVKFTSEGILAGMKNKDIKGCRILLPRADIAPGELTDGLAALGADPQHITAYMTLPTSETTAKLKKLFASGQIDIVTFTSSSTVTNLLEALGDDRQAIRKVKIACIGPVTAATAREAGLKVDVVAEESTIPGLVKAIEGALCG